MGRISIYLGESDKDLEHWYNTIKDNKLIKKILNEYRKNCYKNDSINEITKFQNEIEKLIDELGLALQTIETLTTTNLQLSQEILKFQQNTYQHDSKQSACSIRNKVKNKSVTTETILEKRDSTMIDFRGLMDG